MATAVKNALGILAGVATANLTSPFGNRILNGVPNVHNGMDVTPVALILAPERGVVIQVRTSVLESQTKDIIANKRSSLYAGNYVILRHAPGFETFYYHMASNSITVKVGDVVEKGAVLGKMGNTGYSLGTHLHFAIKIDGKWVDPQPYFTGLKPIPKAIRATPIDVPNLPMLRVITDSLNYRNDANGTKVGQLVKGAQYPFLGFTANIGGYVWAQIVLNNEIVYTASNPLWNEVVIPSALKIPASIVGTLDGKSYRIDLSEVKS